MSDNKPPPPPPPAPEELGPKVSPAVLKMRSSSPSKYFPPHSSRALDQDPTPAGLYFFYGSLQDPSLLVDILKLESPPTLRPAHINGFTSRLWGHYPALLRGDLDDTVTGTVYEVPTMNGAKRLADYEGPSYQPIPCDVLYADDDVPSQAKAYVFLFVGNSRDLSEGSFDLEKWLERRALMKDTMKPVPRT
ncbi:AIG2-like [Penicillium brevicompactum]